MVSATFIPNRPLYKKSGSKLYDINGFKTHTVGRKLDMRMFVLAAIVCALAVPLVVMLAVREDPVTAEWWTTHIQAGWERAVGTFADIFPFSILEVCIVLLIAIGLFLIVRLFINLCTAKFVKILSGALGLAVAAVCVLDLYVMSMGFGYYRMAMPIAQSCTDYSASQTREIVRYFLDDYNALAESFERDENGTVKSPYTFKELAELMKKEYARLDDNYFASYTPTAKPVVNSWYLSSMLITGVTFLPVGEATLNINAPSSSVPLTLAHELAHTKGVQREGDAELLARYILLSSDDDYLRYCGYYGAFDNLLSALLLLDDRDGYEMARAKMSPLINKEWNFEIKYWRSQPDIIGDIAEFFNDLYLKINGAINGTGSYNDGNRGDVTIPVNPDTGKPDQDPDTGRPIVKVTFSKVQKVFFWLYEMRET